MTEKQNVIEVPAPDASTPQAVKRKPKHSFLWYLAMVVLAVGACFGLFVAYSVYDVVTRGIPKAIVVSGSTQCDESLSGHYVTVSGRVENTGKRDTRLIMITLIVSKGGKEVARDVTIADNSDLAPGQKSGFSGMVSIAGSGWDKCRAQVTETR